MTIPSTELAICVTCGTQFDVPLASPPKGCKICDDPRQYVPPTGQAWTSLSKLRESGFKNVWKRDEVDEMIWFVTSEPKIGIGQRAIFIQTDEGNVLWDCVPYIDENFVQDVKSKGGLKAIVISHPHFYTTHLEYASAFSCPVYVSSDDSEWLSRADLTGLRTPLVTRSTEIIPGITAIKAGGHFPGSLLLHVKTSTGGNALMLADTIMTVPSGIYHIARPKGTTSYSFMWSYPNMIPLNPDDIAGIWSAIKPYKFVRTFGGFMGQDVRGDADLRARVLESMKIFVGGAGHVDHALMSEEFI
ncbi:hypothetical protein E6O75_ATG09797 [Venturia nashicola]|uniref:Metallo-beta-lactamase domain-containing protein n=1 Tax=Venturia nashicola TaxID=86259 RepID=A0A4Z1NQT1_9PEZI|nr:hypothetical protein E6O75_ATG09797 [Venturia nashicola]